MKTALILITALALMAFAVLGLSRPAHAAQCGERASMVAALHDQFGETPRAMGLEQRGGMVELFANDAGTWTLIASGPDGKACVVATGVNFRIEKPGVVG